MNDFTFKTQISNSKIVYNLWYKYFNWNSFIYLTFLMDFILRFFYFKFLLKKKSKMYIVRAKIRCTIFSLNNFITKVDSIFESIYLVIAYFLFKSLTLKLHKYGLKMINSIRQSHYQSGPYLKFALNS